ncbi:hypothetical protein [Paenibacillus sp. HW567]|uniref:hypothetical protein n=1 Tax=Paenibacillus sp. HW567 TaxID=1034769 RepID=UPI00036CD67E|nr:hypothetical protein [Paenibacillus sp. HW567]
MSPIGKLFKWGTFAYEAFLAIPFLGGAFVVANAWVPLGVAFLLHIVAVVILAGERGHILGNIVGIITSVVALIPVVGWIMHTLTAIILLVEGLADSRRRPRY